MNFDIEEFHIAEHYLSALINADYSGMDAAECAAFTAWLTAAQNGKIGHWDYDTVTDFMRCEVTGLLAGCAPVRFLSRVAE